MRISLFSYQPVRYGLMIRRASARAEMDLKFWVPTVILPVIIFVISAAIRERKGTAHTAVTDFLVIFIIFDGLFLVDREQVVNSLKLRGNITNIHSGALIMFFLLSAIWLSSLLNLEPDIQDEQSITSADFPHGLWCLSWAIGVGAFMVHVAVLTGRLS